MTVVVSTSPEEMLTMNRALTAALAAATVGAVTWLAAPRLVWPLARPALSAASSVSAVMLMVWLPPSACTTERSTVSPRSAMRSVASSAKLSATPGVLSRTAKRIRPL